MCHYYENILPTYKNCIPEQMVTSKGSFINLESTLRHARTQIILSISRLLKKSFLFVHFKLFASIHHFATKIEFCIPWFNTAKQHDLPTITHIGNLPQLYVLYFMMEEVRVCITYNDLSCWRYIYIITNNFSLIFQNFFISVNFQYFYIRKNVPLQ